MDMYRQPGFTLIEMIIVIVLIGVIAVIAFPRFVDFSSTARTNSTANVAAALSTANSNNFATRTASGGTTGITITNCNQNGALLPGGALPAGYSITSLSISNGVSVTCTLNGPNSTSATFMAYGIS